MAHRTDDLFAYTAKDKGKITAKTDRAVTVTYEDNTQRSIELGRRYGEVAGTTLPHSLVSDLAVGDTVEPGDVIAYNTCYFEKDVVNPKQVLWKAGVMATVAILESTDTLEDSCAISVRLAKELETQVTKIRDIVVQFDQTVHNLAPDGAELDVESILCTIEDPITAQNNLFSIDSLDTLRLLSTNTPRAKFEGVVEKVEVFYNGELEDLSPSLQELALASNRRRKRLARDLNLPYTSGQVTDALRIDNNPLLPNTAVIRVYITGDIPAGVGDKGVFANQMKTIFGRVLSGRNETESGVPLDATFAYQSISARIVLSPEIMGTTNTLLKVISRQAADVYYGKRKK